MAPLRSTLLATLLGALVAATPVPDRVAAPIARETPTGYRLYVGGTHTSINANSGAFWTREPTSVGCPDTINCSGFRNITEIAVFNTGTAAMAANVPGGQDVYIAPSGALSFTEPHGEGVFPNGSCTTGFYQSHTGTAFTLGVNDCSNKGWALCGDLDQVYLLREGNTCDDPRPILIDTVASYDLGAFQYQ